MPRDLASPASTRTATASRAATWDLFCRVIDNFGDIGTCWRLARALASQGLHVRLWTDDASALAWMAPDLMTDWTADLTPQSTPGSTPVSTTHSTLEMSPSSKRKPYERGAKLRWTPPSGAGVVDVHPWEDAAASATDTDARPVDPGDVVIEAFACDPPPAFVERMAQQPTPSVWINLEYLSAEPWVARCHGLPSPQLSGPGSGLTKWFFHPGFTPDTGGLLQEPDRAAAQAAFDARAWRAAHGLAAQADDERLVVLFCYDNPALPALLRALDDQPTLLALTPGPAQAQVGRLTLPPRVRTVGLPWLSQDDFDRLLWSADLNLVRGEDSLVRALWAAKPFVWQLYPQEDSAHHAKMAAFLERWLDAAGLAGRDGATAVDRSLRQVLALPDAAAAAADRRPAHAQPAWVADLRRLWDAWNGIEAPGTLTLPDTRAWAAASQRACQGLSALPELATGLIAFARNQAAPERPAA